MTKPTIKATIQLFFIFVLISVNLPAVFAQEPAPVLAFYYAWFDENTWTSGQSIDLPAQPYTSAEAATIRRHVAQAQSAGINAFVQSWLGPQVENNQTETNFRTLLDVAQAQGFQAAVDFETTSPFLGDAAAVTGALSTLLATHAQHPAYLRYQGKPVIFFWRQQQFSVDEWANIRNQVDPNRSTHWIAEGTDIAYQDIFDGHHLYSIAWAASPAAELAKWGNRVQAYEADHETGRLWVATAMPGYDDTRLPRSNAFSVPRRNGDYYRETWQGALDSRPDMIIITSFNEWLEGTQLEPSAAYGNRYLELTRELVTNFKGSSPAAPPPAEIAAAVQSSNVEPSADAESSPNVESSPDAEASQNVEPPDSAPATQARQQPPDAPYIQTGAITNIRSGPATTFDIVGRLEADSFAVVVGRTETSDWWLIEFESAPDGQAWVSAEVVEFVGNTSSVPVVDAPAAPSEETSDSTGDTAVIRVPAGGVNVRSGPGLDFDLLGRLDAGAQAAVVAKDDSGEWWQIEYEAGENNLAWVADVVVDFSGDPDTVPPAAGSIASEAVQTPVPVVAGSVEATDPVNVRSEPSTEGVILGGLYPGESADVLSISEDGEWWQIEFAAAPAEPAWVAAEFVRFTGEKESVPIFGLGTATPTPGPTNTPTATPLPTATPTIQLEQPTLAPTATSIYQSTSEAILANRGTPDPALTETAETGESSLSWSSIPWGILAVLAIAGFVWYQFIYKRSRRR